MSGLCADGQVDRGPLPHLAQRMVMMLLQARLLEAVLLSDQAHLLQVLEALLEVHRLHSTRLLQLRRLGLVLQEWLVVWGAALEPWAWDPEMHGFPQPSA